MVAPVFKILYVLLLLLFVGCTVSLILVKNSEDVDVENKVNTDGRLDLKQDALLNIPKDSITPDSIKK